MFLHNVPLTVCRRYIYILFMENGTVILRKSVFLHFFEDWTYMFQAFIALSLFIVFVCINY